MEEVHARLSKSGNIVCGKPDSDGRLSCDEQLAAIVTVPMPGRYPERRLTPLPGWRQDRKGIWRRTTQVEALRARGIAPPRPSPLPKGRYPDLPALACCPKCRTVQWLSAQRLKVSAHPNADTPAGSGANRFRLPSL